MSGARPLNQTPYFNIHYEIKHSTHVHRPTMATLALQPTSLDLGLPRAGDLHVASEITPPKSQQLHVEASLNYHKPNEDGSPPHPTYVDRPETYDRPFETHKVLIRDISGDEGNYTLDTNGFQVHSHTSVEKDFVDDDQIKSSYYPEVEQLLKDA